MMSQAKSAAARTNGAKSQGPNSVEGKFRSARNSLKHGLTSKTLVLDNPEDEARFESLLAELIFTHQAVSDVQKSACRHLAIAHWRRDVCDNLEMSFWSAVERGEVCAQSGGDGYPSLNTINRYRARITRDMRKARAELETAKRQRAEAIANELKKAEELSERTLLKEVVADLGTEAFATFRDNVTNEPKETPIPDTASASKPNRSARRRAEKLARKANRRR